MQQARHKTRNFTQAFDRSVDDVHGFLAYRTRSRTETEELTQRTFEQALRSWHSIEPGATEEKAWFLKIARSVYNRSRSGGHAQQRARPEAQRGQEREVFETEPQLAPALSRLGRREREVIALRFGGGLRTAEIAGLLGVSVPSAQQTLARAMRRLLELVPEESEGSAERLGAGGTETSEKT